MLLEKHVLEAKRKPNSGFKRIILPCYEEPPVLLEIAFPSLMKVQTMLETEIVCS
jgi:hypothetical protein